MPTGLVLAPAANDMPDTVEWVEEAVYGSACWDVRTCAALYAGHVERRTAWSDQTDMSGWDPLAVKSCYERCRS